MIHVDDFETIQKLIDIRKKLLKMKGQHLSVQLTGSSIAMAISKTSSEQVWELLWEQNCAALRKLGFDVTERDAPKEEPPKEGQKKDSDRPFTTLW